jgi:ribosomal protein S27E
MASFECPNQDSRDTLTARHPGVEANSVSAHLKCPRCLHEQVLTPPVSMDATIACEACSAQAEFRQFHETWCESRRSLLVRACPELDWPAGD